MNPNIYIVIRNYNLDLAKRQPWYSIKKLIIDLEKLSYNVHIVNDLENIPSSFSGNVIKVFGVKDLFKSKNKEYTLIYFVSFPLYKLEKFFNVGFKILIENWNDLYAIFLVSLMPDFIIKKSFIKADKVITISDRSDDYLNSIGVKSLKYYPYLFDNWGGITPNSKMTNKITLGYFGPPYSTRCFDKVVDFFCWIQVEKYSFNKKIITRIEKEELLKKENKYLSKFRKADVEVVSGMLSRDKLTKELLSIDVFILPFEIIMSELPIVVLESLELNSKLITTPDSGILHLTNKNKNVLILDKFSRREYKNIINFITSSENYDFENVKNKIININKQTISKICQK